MPGGGLPPLPHYPLLPSLIRINRIIDQKCLILLFLTNTFTSFFAWYRLSLFFFDKVTGNMFKVNNKDITTKPMASFCCFYLLVLNILPATLLKQRLWYRCFPMNFVKLVRTFFLQSTSGRLLLYFDSK